MPQDEDWPMCTVSRTPSLSEPTTRAPGCRPLPPTGPCARSHEPRLSPSQHRVPQVADRCRRLAHVHGLTSPVSHRVNIVCPRLQTGPCARSHEPRLSRAPGCSHVQFEYPLPILRPNELRWLNRYSDWLRTGRPRDRRSNPGKVKSSLLHPSRAALGSTQTLIRWLPESFPRG
jgi:hypothetical protein